MDKIFIQIASYRDPLLTSTIRSALHHAKHPSRLVFGICLQDFENAHKRLAYNVPMNQCRIKFVPYKETKGLGWARTEAQSLMTDEKYSLQIDSHSRFTPGWDNRAIKMLKSCPSKKPLISHCCPEWWDTNQHERTIQLPTTLSFTEWDEDTYLVWPSEILSITDPPMQHAFICAHFIFARSNFFREVPIDPQMDYYYEESSMTLRAWTSGWDIYAPNRILVRHTWHRPVKTLRDEQWDKYVDVANISREKWRRLCGMDPNPPTDYSLGKVRTIEEYEKFSGLHYREQTAEPHAYEGLVHI